jgi:hypothetical protein
VQGHVDGTGEFVSLDPLGAENWWPKIRIPFGRTRSMQWLVDGCGECRGRFL